MRRLPAQPFGRGIYKCVHTMPFVVIAFCLGGLLTAQTLSPNPTNDNNQAKDPGVRGGLSGAGGPIAGLTPQQLTLFLTVQRTFNEVDSVLGTIPGEAGSGLGPSFNMNSCAGCHAFPAVGGTGPQTN